MNKEEKIASLYKILPLYESSPEDEYVAYLERISVEYLGMNETDIYYSLQGLAKSGMSLSKRTVKSVVFYMINML